MHLTREAVLALAPDASSSKSAQGLLNPGQWPLLGHDDAAVWGECQGSGAKPYQTQVDLSGPTFRCTCPSRKFPCKHGLALLLLRVDKPASFGRSPAPGWVTEWLQSRAERERKREETVQKRAAAPAEAATGDDARAAAEREARRQAQRWQRIEQGAAELERWIADLMRRGLGSVAPDKLDDWHGMAARLVDAQAPGLAQRLKLAAACIGSGSHWPAQALRRLGLLVLAAHALRRRADLPAATQADLRTVVGWPLDKAELVSNADRVDDRWYVLGCAIDEREDRLTERRVWLQGAGGRRALLLDHAFGGRGFEHLWLVGSSVRAQLAFHPGSMPLRAIALAPPVHADPAVVLAPELDREWDAVTEHLSACPWIPLLPLLLPAAVVLFAPDGLQLRVDDQVFDLAVRPADRWSLLAVGGGHPIRLMAEWDGERLTPLTAWQHPEASPAWQRSVLP